MEKEDKFFKRKRIALTIVITTIIAMVYYQISYKRYFISSKDNTEFITIWQKIGNECYIIPGKYYWIFDPKTNYIKTVNYRNYIGIIWNTNDEYSYKISIYNKFKKEGLGEDVDVYSSNDSLLLEYRILESLDIKRGIRMKSPNTDSLKMVYDYNYIDLNKIFGIEAVN